MHRNLAAFTPPGKQYPPFISINLREDNRVEITVRATPYKSEFKPPKAGAHEPWLVVGQQASMDMALDDFTDLLAQLSASFGGMGI